MKPLLCFAVLLLMTSQLHAEFYSWIDDNGTYNYTEDYSRVPKKFQKKVKRHEDVRESVKPFVSPDSGNMSRKAEKIDAKPAAVSGGEQQQELYGGKSRDVWRTELDVHEAELSRIEQHMAQVRKDLSDTKGINKAQFDALKKDYDDSRTAYDQKYKNYAAVIEAARKAGLVVEIKK